MTQCIQLSFELQGLGKRSVVADFEGGNLSADGGVILLREVDAQTGLIDQLAGCFTDFREMTKMQPHREMTKMQPHK